MWVVSSIGRQVWGMRGAIVVALRERLGIRIGTGRWEDVVWIELAERMSPAWGVINETGAERAVVGMWNSRDGCYLLPSGLEKGSALSRCLRGLELSGIQELVKHLTPISAHSYSESVGGQKPKVLLQACIASRGGNGSDTPGVWESQGRSNDWPESNEAKYKDVS